jgi:hypothetical protein
LAATHLSSSLQNSPEDWISFISSLLAGTSSAMANSQSFMVYGLVIAAIGKALPSLGQPGAWKSRQGVEDWLLFGSAVAGFLATSLSSAANNHPEYALWGVIAGMIGKTTYSLVDYATHKGQSDERLEDIISLIIVAIGGIVYYLQASPTHQGVTTATLVVALGIISKALPSLQNKNNVQSPHAVV